MKLGRLFKAVVTNGLSKGFRRAGVSLNKGENELELTEQQVKVFHDDPHMKIDVLEVVKDVAIDSAKHTVLHLAAARLGLPVTTVISVVELVDALRNDDELRGNVVDNVIDSAVDAASDAIAEHVSDGIENLVLSPVEDFICGLALSSEDEFLHPVISVIDALSAQAKLTKKPNVADLVYQEEQNDEIVKVTPTGAQRDEAWEWYQANVQVVNGFEDETTQGNG